MVARVLFLWLPFPHRRATIKALPTPPTHPRPYRSPGLLPRFPPSVDASWGTRKRCPLSYKRYV